ncbi:MAG TPA: 2-amino-4-hydroxy-6-hydroxymethyldihydropteridine diphosphokinase [Blastocatellia bacterium]|nr:2-amino-4-hydroxy-6-hydroxymethyldihydropteridine diphosphokinase [Blastocatellia bacterium]
MSGVTAFIALGSNLGDRFNHLRAAAEALARHPAVSRIICSRIYETVPVGGPEGQDAFLNAALQLETTLSARELLELLLAIERSRGRERREHWGPRTLDLDLLLYGSAIIREPGLTVPHPRLHERNFVLAPLCDLAPDLIIPGRGQTVGESLASAGSAGLQLTSFSF